MFLLGTGPLNYMIYSPISKTGDVFHIVCIIMFSKDAIQKSINVFQDNTKVNHFQNTLFLPVVILFAVNAAILGEACEFRLQGQFTFTALKTPEVPLLVHSHQVISIRDFSSTAGAQGRLLRIHRGHCLR